MSKEEYNAGLSDKQAYKIARKKSLVSKQDQEINLRKAKEKEEADLKEALIASTIVQKKYEIDNRLDKLEEILKDEELIKEYQFLKNQISNINNFNFSAQGANLALGIIGCNPIIYKSLTANITVNFLNHYVQKKVVSCSNTNETKNNLWISWQEKLLQLAIYKILDFPTQKTFYKNAYFTLKSTFITDEPSFNPDNYTPILLSHCQFISQHEENKSAARNLETYKHYACAFRLDSKGIQSHAVMPLLECALEITGDYVLVRDALNELD